MKIIEQVKSILFCLVAIALIVALVSVVIKLNSPKSSLGGNYTSEPTYLTSSDDWQAVNSLFEYGDLEVVGTSYLRGTVSASGALNSTGGLTASAGLTVSGGDTRIVSLVETGVTTTFTASTTARSVDNNRFTAASFCNQKTIPVVLGNTTTVTLYMPTTASLAADCLTTDGDCRSTNIYNLETVSTTAFAEDGVSSTIKFTSSTTFGALDEVRIDFCRWNGGLYTFRVFQATVPQS